MKKVVCLVFSASLLVGCTFQIPSNRCIYKLACKALKEVPGIPEDATPAPIDEARVSVGKSAAWVELPYDTVDASGEKIRDAHVIWFKRIARTWTVDRTVPLSEMIRSRDLP